MIAVTESRLFRFSRIKEIVLTGIQFDRTPEGTEPDLTRWENEKEPVSVVLRFPEEAASRVYDVFDDRAVTKCGGELTVRAVIPDNEWLYGFLMSFGDKVTVLSPLSLKRAVEKRLKSALQHYEEK
ncbi:helix-turn-helix transcriptional regulator [Hungatella hathewayi]|uniref:helix-turn-helix transcriptional regulator n=1 Tax=Hungatella hathewayi TaxID=154046 RepID=UPI001FA7E4CE|nr:WYL domain-containing protein [Hungatella hathewayi]MCQ4831198.1 WYL domain-containing protein [Hungatella sp. SL.1.14]